MELSFITGRNVKLYNSFDKWFVSLLNTHYLYDLPNSHQSIYTREIKTQVY
jgi:hypothetical protein